MPFEIVTIKVKEPISNVKLKELGFTLPPNATLAVNSSSFDCCNHCYKNVIADMKDLFSIRPDLMSKDNKEELLSVPLTNCETVGKNEVSTELCPIEPTIQ